MMPLYVTFITITNTIFNNKEQPYDGPVAV